MVKGAIIVPVPAEEQCSYRSELADIMVVLCYIADLKRKLNINSGMLIIGCDGLGVINTISNPYLVVKPSMKHFYLLTSVQRLINHCSGMSIEFKHIKGHQDDEKDLGS